MIDDFAIANRVFDVCTLAEREQVLREFLKTCGPSVADRFILAVLKRVRRGPSTIERKDIKPIL